MYSIAWAKKTKKQLEKLPLHIRENIINKVVSITEDPKRYLKRLKNYKAWRLRIGDYRAIIEISETDKIICVVEIGHRKNIYEKPS